LSAAEVRKLHEDPKPAAAPAIGYSIIATLGDKRQMTVQYFVAGDEPLPLIHANVDRTMAVLDRQIAKYELDGIRQELARATAEYDQAELDQKRLDEETAKANALRDVQMATLQGQIDIEQEGAHAKHVQGGREGPFKLQGYAKANIERARAQIEKLKVDNEKALAEMRVSHEGRKGYRVRMGAEMARMRADIETREALIGG